LFLFIYFKILLEAKYIDESLTIID